MRAWLQPIIDWITAYYGDKWYLLFVVIAYLYLLFATKDSRKRFVYPCMLIGFLVLNPVLYQYVYTKIVYWRLFWLFPNGLVIAYATVLFMKRRKHIAAKLLAPVVLVCLIVAKGTNMYTHAGLAPKANMEKVSVQTKEVCDMVLALSDHPRMIAAFDLCSEIRQYSGDIELMYGRNAEGYINLLDDISMRVANEMRSETPDFEFIFMQAVAKKYEFVVVESYKSVDGAILNRYGYTLASSVGGYNVYDCKDINTRTLDGALVTQYGPNAWYNSCYTIEDADNNLIIIDGGYAGYEKNIRSIIRAHGNRVAAWIVTSPMNSCAQSFCRIMNDKQGITVDAIYSIEISDTSYEVFVENAESWQHPEICKDLRDILKREKNVHYVKENDVFEELGLTFRVLHTWNEETDAIGKYQDYNGSMCFTVEGKQEKMLFLSKLSRSMEKPIIDRHRDELDVDYVQANNSGEWSFSQEFYALASPRYVFMDCGAATKNPDNTQSDAWGISEALIKQGIHVLDFESVPNVIVLK